MRIGLIGCGGIAINSHMPAILQIQREIPQYELVACCDLNEEAAKGFAGRFSIPAWYASLDEMLAGEHLDGALCFVSESANHVVAGELLARGIPTFLEKPPGQTPEELVHLLERQALANTGNMVGFNRRFMPAYKRVKELAAGRPMRYLDYAMYRVKRHENHFETTAIHAVDAVQHICGCGYKKLRMRYQMLPEFGENVCNMYLDGEMENGCMVTIRILVSTGELRERFELHLDDVVIATSATGPYDETAGGLIVKEGGRETLRLGAAEIDPLNEVFSYNGFVEEHRSFYRLLSAGIRPACTLQDVWQSVQICGLLKKRRTSVSF